MCIRQQDDVYRVAARHGCKYLLSLSGYGHCRGLKKGRSGHTGHRTGMQIDHVSSAREFSCAITLWRAERKLVKIFVRLKDRLDASTGLIGVVRVGRDA